MKFTAKGVNPLAKETLAFKKTWLQLTEHENALIFGDSGKEVSGVQRLVIEAFCGGHVDNGEDYATLNYAQGEFEALMRARNIALAEAMAPHLARR